MPTGALAPLPRRLGPGGPESRSPEQHARLTADVVAMTRVAPLAVVKVHQELLSPYTASVEVYRGQNGVGLAHAPTLTLNGAGDFSLTWPAYWTDEYDVQFPIRIRMARASACSSFAISAPRLPVVELVSGRAVRVRAFSQLGAAIAATVTVKVW